MATTMTKMTTTTTMATPTTTTMMAVATTAVMMVDAVDGVAATRGGRGENTMTDKNTTIK